MADKPEVLSPAGGRESMLAAAAAGADAVYFGAGSFNARAGAENFDGDALVEAVSFCHINGMKAYLTLNTVVFEHELDKALQLVERACAAGIDAFIVQDMGLLSLIKRAVPKARLHASTQMSVHNIDGVMELAQMGFSRVVLARELEDKEIALIAKESPVELEVFVHGALCMSMSGQCFMSAFFSGSGGIRSANRGMCAQPCRLPFSVAGTTCGNVLSLKDLSLAERVSELADMGIRSFKIEGRMKRPEYVAAAVSVFRKAADGIKPDESELENLQAVFSRSGFTKGYYEGKRDRDMFGTRRHEDVVAAEKTLRSFRRIYENTVYPRMSVDFKLKIKNPAVELYACDKDGNTAFITGAAPETAQIKAMDEQTAAQKLSKTGGTPFYAGSITVETSENLTVPVFEINRLRREALEELTRQRAIPKKIPFSAPELSTVLQQPVNNFETQRFVHECIPVRLRLQYLSQLPSGFDPGRAELVFIPVTEAASNTERVKELVKSGVRMGIELPRAIFNMQSRKRLEDLIRRAAEAGVTDILCGNLGAFALARESGLAVHGDFGLNAVNSQAAGTYAELGARSVVLSPETPVRSVKRAAGKNIKSGLIVYGRLPLMLTRNCPVKSFRGCGSGCLLKDRMGCEFPVLCLRDTVCGGYSEILNSRPVWLADKKGSLNADFVVLYFTTESETEAEQALTGWENGSKFGQPFSRGLYFA